jgi:hypothetical protein
MKAYEKGDMVVANENTLGFVIRCSNMLVTISVIATNYLNGGDPTLNGRTTCAMVNKTRKANKADQDIYKCVIS